MIIFHHNDADGRCSAAIAFQFWAEAFMGETNPDRILLIEMEYSKQVPVERIEENEQVVIVDFSFKPDVMAEVLKRTTADRIQWIDHHVTAKDYDYGVELPGLRNFENKAKAACELAWEFYYPQKTMPLGVRLVGDYDKWALEIPQSKTFVKGLTLCSQDPISVTWNRLLADGSDKFVDEIYQKGITCKEFQEKTAADYTEKHGYEAIFHGHTVFACGGYLWGSDKYGDRLEQYPILLSHEFMGDHWIVGLYSKCEHIHVGEIAQQYGGGGHKGAAGFIVREGALPWKLPKKQ